MANFNDFMSIEELREALAGKSHGQIMKEVKDVGYDEVLGKVFMGMAMAFNPKVAGNVNAVVRYDLRDANNNTISYFVKMKDGQCSVDQEDPGVKPRVHISTTVPLFLKLAAGRLKLLWPLLFRTLRIGGDKAFAAKMQKIFR
jgi:hypothetical protein